MHAPAKRPPIVRTTELMFFTKTELKRRKWNDSLMQQLLGRPDETLPNPHRKSSSMSLFAMDRVLRAEQHPSFLEHVQRSVSRRAAARKAASTREAALLDRIDGLQVEVPQFPRDELERRAYEHYRVLCDESDWEGGVNHRDFMDRLCVNYLRHEATGYDREMDQIRGKTGASQARLALKEKILDAISEEYPELSAECSRQEARARKLADDEQIFA